MGKQGEPTGHWLTRSHVSHRRRQTMPTVMHYYLRIGQFVKNQTVSVQFSSVTSLCAPFIPGLHDKQT